MKRHRGHWTSLNQFNESQVTVRSQCPVIKHQNPEHGEMLGRHRASARTCTSLFEEGNRKKDCLLRLFLFVQWKTHHHQHFAFLHFSPLWSLFFPAKRTLLHFHEQLGLLNRGGWNLGLRRLFTGNKTSWYCGLLVFYSILDDCYWFRHGIVLKTIHWDNPLVNSHFKKSSSNSVMAFIPVFWDTFSPISSRFHVHQLLVTLWWKGLNTSKKLKEDI